MSTASEFEAYIRRVNDEMVESLNDPERLEADLAAVKRRAAEQRAGECLGCGSLVIRPVGQELWCSWCIAEG